jgi:hypothetical protein
MGIAVFFIVVVYAFVGYKMLAITYWWKPNDKRSVDLNRMSDDADLHRDEIYKIRRILERERIERYTRNIPTANLGTKTKGDL